jgi:hypothetical protein
MCIVVTSVELIEADGRTVTLTVPDKLGNMVLLNHASMCRETAVRRPTWGRLKSLFR